MRNARIAFHGQGAQAPEAVLASVDSAGHGLDVCTFVFGDDVVGRRVAVALQRARTTRPSRACSDVRRRKIHQR